MEIHTKFCLFACFSLEKTSVFIKKQEVQEWKLFSKDQAQKACAFHLPKKWNKEGSIVLDPEQNVVLKPTKLNHFVFILYQEASASQKSYHEEHASQ